MVKLFINLPKKNYESEKITLLIIAGKTEKTKISYKNHQNTILKLKWVGMPVKFIRKSKCSTLTKLINCDVTVQWNTISKETE